MNRNFITVQGNRWMLIIDKLCAILHLVSHLSIFISSLEFGTLLHLWLYKQYMGKKDNKRSIAIKTSDQSEEINGTEGCKYSRFCVFSKREKMSSSRRNDGRQTEKHWKSQITWPSLPFAGKEYCILSYYLQKCRNLYLEKKNGFWVRRLLDLSSETGTRSFILTKQVTNICPTGSSCTVKHLNIFTLISACTWIQTKCFLLSTNISITTFFTKDDHFLLLSAPLYPSEIYRNHPRLWATLRARIIKDCP